MRSFLRHLAASVIRPQTSLHPFPESIYHARQPGSAPSSASLISSTSVEQDSISIAPPAAFPRVPVTGATSRIESQSDASTRSQFEPLLPHYHLEGPRIANTVAQPSPQSEVDTQSRSSSKPQLTPAEGDQARGSMERVVMDRAVQSDSAIAKSLPLIPIQHQLIAPQVKAPRPAQAPTRSFAEAPHTDDIQIHIGRVEVIAVPPAEPRRTPPPARKGLSLDEYLSRRNGRVG